MMKFRRQGIRCVFEPDLRPNHEEKFYYFLLGEFLGLLLNEKIELTSFAQDAKHRSIVYKRKSKWIHMKHSWGGSFSSRVSRVTINNATIGNMRIYIFLQTNEDITQDEGAWKYSKDLYQLYKEGKWT